MRNLYGRRQQMVRRCRCRFRRHRQIVQGFTLRNWNPCRTHNFRLNHWNRLTMASFARNLCYRCPGTNLESGNTNSNCRPSLRRYCICSSLKQSKRARLEIFGCTLDLDRTIRVQTSCRLRISTLRTQRSLFGLNGDR